MGVLFTVLGGKGSATLDSLLLATLLASGGAII